MQLSLESLEELLAVKIKAREQVAVDTLRGLKTRIQNEQITKGSSLTSEEILALVKSEAKRRREALEAFTAGNRPEAAAKEAEELQVLAQFLPEQLSEQAVVEQITQQISENSWTQSDFGKAMGQLKAHFGNSADGALVAKILKENLK